MFIGVLFGLVGFVFFWLRDVVNRFGGDDFD